MPKKLHLRRVQFSDVRTKREEQILRRGVKAGVAMALTAMRELHSGRVAESLEDGALESLRRRGAYA
jgi:hypothetical protein